MEATHPVVGIAGAVGGCGASSFAAALAHVGSGVLVDVDPASGGVDLLLALERSPGPRWSGLRLGGGRLDPAVLSERLPRWGTALVLAADCAPDASGVDAVVDAAAAIGPVIVDLGRVTTEAQRTAVSRCSLLVLVVPADVIACAAARACVEHLPAPLPVGAVVRRGSVPSAEAADLAGVPLLARLPATPARRPEPWSAPRRMPRTLHRAAVGILDGAAP